MENPEKIFVGVLAEKDFERISEESTLSEALGKFWKGNKTLLVFDNGGKLAGILDESHIFKSKSDPSKTKVKSVYSFVPKAFESENLLRAARLLIESDVKAIPVLDENNMVSGVLKTEAVLREAAKTALGKDRVINACTANPITASEKTTIGEAFNTMREKNLSHLPVLDRKGTGIGMLSMHDIVTKYFSPHDKARGGEVISEKIHELKIPATNLMNYPLEQVFENETIRKAVEKMLEKNASALVVLDSAGKISGIITKTDILQHLLQHEKEKPLITFSYAKSQGMEIDEIDLAEIKNYFEKFAHKYSHFLKESHAYVYIKKNKEHERQRSTYDVRVRITSSKGLIAAHTNGVGLTFAVHEALDKIIKQTEKKKTRQTVS